jgi:hypothetical protein
MSATPMVGPTRALQRIRTAAAASGRWIDGSRQAGPLSSCVGWREGDSVKTLAFVMGLCIVAVGAIGIVTPSALVWIARRFGTAADWYALAAVRLAFAALLLWVASASRAPRTLRVVALIPLVAGLAALATPFVGVERARAALDWWSGLGSGYVRLTAVPLLALGGFIAYACAPTRRPA